MDIEDEPEEKTKCQYCMTGCKQLATFLLSHVGLLTLVVGYCLIGAVTFEALEATHEREVCAIILLSFCDNFL